VESLHFQDWLGHFRNYTCCQILTELMQASLF